MILLRSATIVVIFLGTSLSSNAAQPRTMRVDYTHSGNALQDIYSLDKVPTTNQPDSTGHS